jgi:G3E family GTPase
MTGHSEARVRLTIVGGYLGSGKTTWLRHQLHAGRFKDAFVIVNEAAETPVDDALLGQSSRLAVLAGGCVCCTAKADLIALLRKLCDERSQTASTGERLKHIVLETSGLADPGPIVDAIRSDPVLVYHVMVDKIIVAVDALHALSQLRSEPLGRRQIEIADQLVVTKVDVAEEVSLIRLLATLHHLNPGAGLSGAARGTEVSLPDFGRKAPEELPDLANRDPSPIYPTRLHLGGDVDWTAFTVWLSALLHARGDDVVRVKGVVRTPAGRLLLQTVRKVVQSPEILPEQAEEKGREDDTIVVIGRGYTPEELRCSLHHFAKAGRGLSR